MCLYAEYDDASRLSAIYDGDGGKTVYWRDGPGRLIQRELAVTGANIALWNSKDVIERDVLGRLTRTEIKGGGPTAHALPVVTEWFDQDSLGRTHQEKFRFGWAPSNDVEVNSTWTGGNPFRDGLGYADNLFAGSAPLSMTNAHDEIGRLTGIDWTGHSGAAEELASYGWVGGLRRTRAVKYSSSTWPEGRTYFDYDTYGRLTGIDDRIWTSPTPPSSSASKFGYEYDAASNLTKEIYDKVDGTSAGDRFGYDAHHRLTQAWMGVSQTVMDDPQPTGWVSGVTTFLTYGYDGANNRTQAEVYTSPNQDSSTDYSVQDGTHPQGPSNRYDKVGFPGGPEYMEYDDRGNLTYDGRFYYRYDFLNRLQEVWRVAPDQGGGGEEEKFEVPDADALEDAKAETESLISDLMQRLPHEHDDPVFRARLRARIRGGVIRFDAVGMSTSSAAAASSPEGAELELVAVYTYDAFNRRIGSVIVGEQTQLHAWDGWRQTVQYEAIGDLAVLRVPAQAVRVGRAARRARRLPALRRGDAVVGELLRAARRPGHRGEAGRRGRGGRGAVPVRPVRTG